jgi:hypothetical protein
MFQDQEVANVDTSQSSEINDAQPSGGSKFEAAMEALNGSLKAEPAQEQPSQPAELSEEKSDDTPANIDWEARYKEVQQQKDREVSAAQKQLEKLAVDRVGEDPQYIHTLAQTDRNLADRIVKNDEWCKSQGIRSYDQLIKEAEKENLSPEIREVYEKELEPLKKGFEELQAKLAEKEQAEAKEFYDKFKAERPDLQGDLEAKTWELFEASKLSLEECYEFVKFKSGVTTTEKDAETKAWESVAKKTAAAAVAPSGQRSTPVGAKKAVPSDAINFLEGIGAGKTLSKYQ